MLPTISVAITTYQHRAFIGECLDSVLLQDYPNLEIVVGDDGSTDGTADIVRDYAARFPQQFKPILSPVNTGVTENTNRIFRACTGDYIAHFSGDDVWLPGKLHKQVRWFEKNPGAAICYTNVELIDGTGRTLRLQHERRRNPYREGGMEQFFKSSTFFNGTSVLLRRAAAPAHGFDARLKTVSDWLYFLETAKNGRVGYIPEVLARYRVHEGSVSQNTDVMLADFLVAIGIAESKFPELIRFGRRLRGEFMTACALQYLRAARYDKASEYLRLAMRLRPFGTSYTRFPLNVVLYVLARTNRLDLVDMLLRAQANARARLSTRS